jgi:LysR family transcriptional regulator, nitrogen assimilation regulatory protein
VTTSSAPSGRVVLGLIPTVSWVLSSRFARRVIERLPPVQLCIVESYGGHLVEWLHRGQMDMALIYGPSVDLHLSMQTLGRDNIVAVGPCVSGLAGRKEVSLEWISDETLVLPSHSQSARILNIGRSSITAKWSSSAASARPVASLRARA